MTTDLRTFIIADDPLVRAGLAALLGAQLDIHVIGQMTSRDDLQIAVETYRPEIVLWDLGWDPEALREVVADFVETLSDESAPEPALPVVALIPEDVAVNLLWSAGVRGLLRRDASAAQLAHALRTVTQGLVVADPAFTASLAIPEQHAPQHPQAEELIEELTPREFEVLQLMAEGIANKTIARRLKISEHTVKFHINAILGKLHAQSRTEAVVRATRAGLILL